MKNDGSLKAISEKWLGTNVTATNNNESNSTILENSKETL